MAAAPEKVAVVMLTPACALACPYCGAEAGFRALGPDEAHGLLGRLAGSGVQSVVLGGGEPLLWPHGLRGLAAAAQDLGLLVQVGTSAHGLPPGAEGWAEVDRWVLPLESADAAAHDALRPTAGSHHAEVLAALDRFRRAGAEVTVSSVARLGGEADLHSVAALLEERRAKGLRLHAWHVYRFQAMGRGGAMNAGRFALDDAAWAALAQDLRRRHPRLPLLLRPDMLHSRQVAFYWAGPGGIQRQAPRPQPAAA